jgi:mannose-6-phosphate isomerase-like protein (cupin superfamily)
LEWANVKPLINTVSGAGAKAVSLDTEDGRHLGTAYELGGGVALIVLTGEDVLHRHQGFIETYVPLNAGTMRLDDMVFEVTPGVAYEVPLNTWHACCPPADQAVMVFWCFSKPEFDPCDFESHQEVASGWSKA